MTDTASTSDATPPTRTRGWLPADAPLRHALVLGGLALAAALILSATDIATRDAIAAVRAETRARALAQVLPTDLGKTTLETRVIADAAEGPVEVFLARREGGDGRVAVAAFELTGQGYGGAIRVLIGVAPDGRVTGVRVLSHAETPGLGDDIEARKSDWIHAFVGRALGDPAADGWAVRKDGGIFDQFSGATITPRAVVDTVRRGLDFHARHADALRLPDALPDGLPDAMPALEAAP